MSLVFDISNIKESTEERTFEPIAEGRYVLKIEEADIVIADSGTKRFIVHYDMPEISRKLKYDSMSLQYKDGTPIKFGILKAKTLAIKAGVIAEDAQELDIEMIKKALIGKTIEADVIVNDRGYGEIKGLGYYTHEINEVADSAVNAGDITFDL